MINMNHTNLIIGKLNTYKTTGILFPEVSKAIKNGENLFILDNKEEYYRTFQEELDHNHYTTYVFHLEDAYHSHSFNPLMTPYQYYQEGKKDKATEIVKNIALELFQGDNVNSDPFWSNTASNYFTALALILFKEAKKPEVNLGSIQIMISQSDQLKTYFDQLDVLDPIYISGSATVYAPSETKASIISVLRQKLNDFCVREQLFQNLLGNEICLNQLKEKCAIFFIGNEKVNCLGNILIDQLVEVSLDHHVPFTFFLDDFCDMPALLAFEKMLQKKVNMFVTTRYPEELEEKYGKLIMGKFERCINSVDVVEKDNVMKFGNCHEYPKAKEHKGTYFSVEQLVSRS